MVSGQDKATENRKKTNMTKTNLELHMDSVVLEKFSTQSAAAALAGELNRAGIAASAKRRQVWVMRQALDSACKVLAAHLNNRPAEAAQQAPLTLDELLVLDRLAKRYAEWCSQRGYAVFAQQCGSFIEMVEVDARQMGGSAAPWTHEIHCIKCGAALRPMPASISPMQMPAITCSCATFIVGIDDINAEPFQGWPATMFDIHAVAKGGR
jgi:hypothetical protein